MADPLMWLVTFAFLATVVGVFRPYKGFKRGHFALGILGSVTLMGIIAPHTEVNQKAAPTAAPAGEKPELAVERTSANNDIAAKAKSAVDTRVRYTRADNAKTVKLVGSKMFGRLNDLEPGAYYAASSSSACDSVANGAVSLSSSKANAPRWFVDCKNNNRFMISLQEAEKALALAKAGKLVETSRAPDCTIISVASCSMTPAQKSFNKAEASVFCDMIVEKALISEPDMDWGSDMSFGDDGEVTISRGFTAQNGFGAELKNRYFCTLDSETKNIKRLILETPFGDKQLI